MGRRAAPRTQRKAGARCDRSVRAARDGWWGLYLGNNVVSSSDEAKAPPRGRPAVMSGHPTPARAGVALSQGAFAQAVRIRRRPDLEVPRVSGAVDLEMAVHAAPTPQGVGRSRCDRSVRGAGDGWRDRLGAGNVVSSSDEAMAPPRVGPLSCHGHPPNYRDVRRRQRVMPRYFRSDRPHTAAPAGSSAQGTRPGDRRPASARPLGDTRRRTLDRH